MVKKIFNFLKKHRQVIKRLVWLCFIVWLLINTFRCLQDDSCRDLGGVWDDAEKRCRDDCLTWNKVNGCIYMDEEYSQVFETCANTPKLCDNQKFDELTLRLCQKYQGAWQLDDKYCDFEFVKEKCGKLPGKWQYPEICD